MTCEQFVARIRARLDDELFGEHEVEFDRHAAECERCSAYMAAYKRAIIASHSIVDKEQRAELPEDLVQSIMDEIRKAKNPN